MIYSSKPEHRHLGRDLEFATKRMALIRNTVLGNSVASRRLIVMTEEMEDHGSDVTGVYRILESMQQLNALLEAEFETNREWFLKLDKELQEVQKQSQIQTKTEPETHPGVPEAGGSDEMFNSLLRKP